MDDDLLWTSDRPRWSGMYYHREHPGAASMLVEVDGDVATVGDAVLYVGSLRGQWAGPLA